MSDPAKDFVKLIAASKGQSYERFVTENLKCRARQNSDQMYCHVCALTADMNDPEPPPCGLNKATKMRIE